MTKHLVTITSDIVLPLPVTPTAISSLVRHVLDSEGVVEPWHVGIRFVGDVTMQAAHNDFIGINEPTDIMTFPYDDEDDVWGGSEKGGDLMISVDTAMDNASAADWTLHDELFFLIVHGLLHLLGWDDENDIDRADMLEHQHRLILAWTDRP